MFKLINDVVYYYETSDYVFTHAFIPYDKKNLIYDPMWRNSKVSDWCKSVNNMKGFKLAIVNKVLVQNKTLVLGHIGAYYGNITKYHPDIEIDSLEFKKLGNQLMRKCIDNKKYLFLSFKLVCIYLFL